MSVPKGTAAVMLGIALGVMGVLIYTQLRDAQAEDDVQALIDRITDNLQDLEHGSALVEV